MTWQLIALADVPPSPWRNGGGVTRELIAWPDPQAWRWRISVAEVASNGPFSRFEGVRRWLAILSGAVVRLDFPGRGVELTPHDPPLAFSGTDPVDCRLLDGPVQDLNLMVRSAGDLPAVGGHMQRVSGSLCTRLDADSIVAVYNRAESASACVDGVSTSIAHEYLAWCSLPAGSSIDIDARDAIWMVVGN